MRGLGLAFNSTLSFFEMIDRLNAVGPWSWHERDSAWYGNLASARSVEPDLRILFDLMESGGNEVGGSAEAGEGRQFCLSLRFESSRPDEETRYAALEEAMRNEMLPALGASDVVPTDTID
jgi:hypothetical protein